MTPSATKIKHSELFSSAESLLEFFSPKSIEGDKRGMCRPFTLPFWHPMSIKGMGLISLCEKIEDNKIKLIFAFPVNRDLPFNISVENNWMACEAFTSSFEGITAFFVNGTQFGTENGTAVIVEGPKEFTWTYKEPKESFSEEEPKQ